ncbi:WG repeat-containing protein [Fulvivirga lutimaris]|uniref:WG repeat-containing protein n=1 Tax=Fulvivirga lutimaris TaxID=1819566 RepID=UPI0012BBF36D|nr:WG repeat-containing protein [Fulvivirga lutimaris]MTI41790.1 WG repeat-containing protein [Fulvivirga lutimaris]
MPRKSLIYFIFSIYCLSASAQTGNIKKALKLQEKGKIEKAQKQIEKAFKKDASLPAAIYATAKIQFDTAYHNYNIDSAYFTLLEARKYFGLLEEKDMEKHAKIGVNLVSMDEFKREIETAAFLRARLENTEDRLNYFLETFPKSKQEASAVKIRDSLAFQTARRTNTYGAYEDFMSKYPNALQYDDAKQRYEKLYFTKSTADGKLDSYVKFLQTHGTTPYRFEAERNIYEISTADNEPKSYLAFMDKYPKSNWVKKARRVLYHVLKDKGEIESFPKKWLTDSLATIIKYDTIGPLIPVYKAGKYGFVDLKENQIIKSQYTNINSELLCHVLETDFFQSDEGVIARDGSAILPKHKGEVEDMGSGLLKVKYRNSFKVFHKSGWEINSDYWDDVKLLNGKFIAFKLNDKWGLMSVAGRNVTKAVFDNISTQGPFYIFELDEKYDALTANKLAEAVDKNPINFNPIHEDFELLEGNKLWLQSTFGEMVLDEYLNETIPFNEQKIKVLSKAVIVKGREKIELLTIEYKLKAEKQSDKMEYNDEYLGIKMANGWELYSFLDFTLIDTFDTLTFYGSNFLLAGKGDTTLVYFAEKSKLLVKDIESLKFLTSSGASQYLAINYEDKKKTYYFDMYGNFVINENFESINPIGKEYLVTTDKGKKGLINNKGKELLRPKYDAVANYSNGYISYLQGKKFGLIHSDLDVKVDAEYDRNIVPYNSKLLVAEKNGKLGFVRNDGKEISDFGFEDIKFWQDSVALVKTNYLWKYFDIYNNTLRDGGYKSYHYQLNTPEEIVIIARGDQGYGVFSSTRGEVIAPTFNDLINVGSTADPIYFTEKHVEEAEFYVVIYYDKTGQIIRKQAFEAADYMLIYCEQ